MQETFCFAGFTNRVSTNPTQVTRKPLGGEQVKHWLSHFDAMSALSQGM